MPLTRSASAPLLSLRCARRVAPARFTLGATPARAPSRPASSANGSPVVVRSRARALPRAREVEQIGLQQVRRRERVRAARSPRLEPSSRPSGRQSLVVGLHGNVQNRREPSLNARTSAACCPSAPLSETGRPTTTSSASCSARQLRDRLRARGARSPPAGARSYQWGQRSHSPARAVPWSIARTRIRSRQVRRRALAQSPRGPLRARPRAAPGRGHRPARRRRGLRPRRP